LVELGERILDAKVFVQVGHDLSRGFEREAGLLALPAWCKMRAGCRRLRRAILEVADGERDQELAMLVSGRR